MKRMIVWTFMFLLLIAGTASANVILIRDIAVPQDKIKIQPEPAPPIKPRPIPRPMPMPPERFLPPAQQNIFIQVQGVEVKITDQIAETMIDQTFHNPNDRILEGEYIFPLSSDANIEKFSMYMDGKEVEGKVLDRDEARNTYESIVRSQRDPGLLEYVGNKMIKCRVFPIPAKGDVRIKIKYHQPLNMNNDLFHYSFPLNVASFTREPLKNVNITININSKVPLKNILSTSHEIGVTRKNDNEAVVAFEKENILPDKDFELYFSRSDDSVGVSTAAFRKSGEKGYFMMMVAPSYELKKEDVVAKDVVFVIDTSGSMKTQDPATGTNKFDKAKEALRFCLKGLNKEDRFNIVDFSNDVRTYEKNLARANEKHIAAALDFVDKMDANGGTNIHGALMASLSMGEENSGRPFNVIFITDGKPTMGELREPEAILKAVRENNKCGAHIFAFGVGYELNVHLLDNLAGQNNGAREYAAPNEDISQKLSAFYTKVSSPLLADVKIDFGEGIRADDIYPKTLPGIFAGCQLTVLGRYDGDGSKKITVTGKVNGKDRAYTYNVDYPKESGENASIPKLWAQRKVAYMVDDMRLHGENPELKKEIVQMCQQYGILSEMTAWLVLEANPPRPMPPGRPTAPSPAMPMIMKEADKMPAEEKLAMSGGKADGKFAVEASRRIAKNKSGEGFGAAKDESADTEANSRQRAMNSQMLTVGDKTFYLVNNVWTDSTFKPEEKVTTVKIKMFSDEYFKFLKDNPQYAKLLSRGAAKILLDKKLYEIVP